jgi:hypothetical protein
MSKGPQEARLDRAVSGAARSAIQAAEQEWRNGARSLGNVAIALDQAGPEVIANFGGTHTGPAAQRAFAKVAEKVRARKAQMEQAADALARADAAVGQAQQVQASLGALPSAPSRPDIAPGTNDADAVRQQRAYSTQLGSYHAAMADREARAEAAANEMDRVYRESTSTMEQVHGEPTARDGGAGAAGGGDSSGGAGGTTGGPRGGGTSPTTIPATTSGSHTGYSSPATTTAGAPHVVAPTGATPPVLTAGGTAQDGTALPAVSSPPATVGASGVEPASTGPTSAGAAGGLAGALGGGLLGGAAGIGGAVRGGGTVVASPTTAGRSIGSTARSATAGALGRGGATVTSGSTGTSRTGTSAVTRAAAPAAGGRAGAATGGAGGTGRAAGRGVAGSTGSTGSAGGRGSTGAERGSGTRPGARGAGTAAVRSGRNGDEQRFERDPLFESPQDWVDDEDAAPGVID